jgi:transposase
MRPKGGAAVLEARRRRALALLKADKDVSLHDVARRVGCAPSSVMRWRDAVADQGPTGIAVHASPGRPPKLTAAQQRRLVKAILAGPIAAGYATDLWTTPRIAELIQTRFGVSYHPDHVGRLLHALGWTPQKPERRALQRDEAAIARWKAREWPRVKKTPRGWAPTSSSSTNRASS